MSKASREIKRGASVRLKSDPTKFAMSVESIEDDTITCVWREDRKACFEQRAFPREALTAAKDVGSPITKIEMVPVVAKFRTLETLERITGELGPAINRIIEKLGAGDADSAVVRTAVADLERQAEELREASGGKLL